MNKKILLPILVLIVVGAPAAFYYLKPSSEVHPSEEVTDQTEPTVSAEQGVAPTGKMVTKKGLELPPPKESNEQELGFLSTETEDKKKFEVLDRSLKDLGACLQIKTGSLDKNDQISFDSFNNSMSADLGEVVNSTELWATTDLRTESGEVRRILIENNVDGSTSVGTLSYWSFKNGTQTELPLSNEQRANPTDALIASLEADGKVFGGAMSRKIFYTNGGEVTLLEKNGQMAGLSVEHEGRTFRCENMDTADSTKCNCQ